MRASPCYQEAREFLASRGITGASVACVLGSGLGSFAEELTDGVVVETRTIPGFPAQTVRGHGGHIVAGAVEGRRVLVLQGRTHYYETGDLAPVLFPVRLLHALGVTTLLLTNAAGGISPHLNPGDLMAITDQINLTLRRFPPRAAPRGFHHSPLYAPSLVACLEQSALTVRANLRRGVYAGVLGPSYETAAEIRMIARLGADAVGMSTVWEAICASGLGMEIAGISCITNRSTGLSDTRLSHEEVTTVGAQVAGSFGCLVREFLRHTAMQRDHRKMGGALSNG